MEVGSKATHEGSETCEANWSNKTQEEGAEPIDVICMKTDCEGTEHTENSGRSGSVSVAALCQGFSKLSGMAMPNTAVIAMTHSETGASTFVNYMVCKGEQELMNAIGLEQSLGASFRGGSISFDQKLQFVNSLQVSIHSVSIVIRARKRLGLSTVTQAELRSDLAAPVTDEELRRFFRIYGDSFVSEMEQGGDYIACYTFYSQSVTQQETVSLSIQGQLGMGIWGSVNSSLSSQVETVTQESKVRVEFNQYISGIQHLSLPAPENCVDFALGFPEMELDAPVILSFSTSGYEALPKMDEFQSIAKNRELLAGGSPTDNRSFRGLLLRVNSVKNAIAQIKEIHTFYRINTERIDPRLASVERQADADEGFLQAIINSYLEDPLGHISIPTGTDQLPSLNHGIPVFNIRTTVVGNVRGAPGQTPFDDVGDPMAFCQQLTRITSIALWSTTNFIDNLAVTYSSGLGSITARTTIDHGRPNHGNLEPILSVPIGHHVSGMSTAYWEPRVPPLEGLRLTISDGRSVSGGRFNSGTIQETNNVPPQNSFMLGFQGRFGWNLDQVQLIYGIFGSSTWEE